MSRSRSAEVAVFYHAVYSAVQEIPPGRVTTYGHIAALIGTPERPRQVGICLKQLSSDPENDFNSVTVPWQRVINAKGIISPRSNDPAGAQNQAEALRDEGVEVTTLALGELKVDFSRYGWFPRHLPSEVARGDWDDESAGGDLEGETADDGQGAS